MNDEFKIQDNYEFATFNLKQLIKSRSIPPLGVRWLITFA